MKLPVPIRLLKERYFGEAARNPWVARNRLAKLSEQLPPAAVPVVSAAVDLLMDYQDPDYALLYLDRVGRYVGPGCPLADILTEISRLMADRMMFEDPIRSAQIALDRVAGATGEADSSAAEMVRKFTSSQLAAMLPSKAARPILNVLTRLGWSDASMSMHFGGSTGARLWWLKALAAMRRVRPYSYRFSGERVWVERWLHMIDRSQVKQHEAAWEVVETARLITGTGISYQRGVENWNAVIEGLVKPVCDGRLSVPDFAMAVRTAREAAEQLEGDRLKQVIASLISGGSAPAAAAR